MRLQGSNPDIDGGRAIHLSLDLSGPLIEVMRADPLMRDLVERLSQGLLDEAAAASPENE